MSLRRKIRDSIQAPDDHRRYVRRLFDRIAGRYDLTNDVMSLGLHRRWKRRLVDMADLEPGDAVLDLAAGTGDLALEVVRRDHGGPVVAGDLSPGMMREGSGRPGAGPIAWVGCDALELPFATGSFDRVFVGYGLRNFPDLDRSLEEIRRVLRPGGWLLTLDFGKPPSPLLRRLYFRYLELSTAAAGWLLHRDREAYLYIPESLRKYPDQDGVADAMLQAGFEGCGWTDLVFGTMAIHAARRPAPRPGSSGSPR